jgi:hypothetical protein
VLEQVIVDLQITEQSIDAKTLPSLKIRLALRGCLKELRALAVSQPRGRDDDRRI